MKPYRIDESEKQRILGMHVSATKNQYLTEQNSGKSMKGSLVDIAKRENLVPKDFTKENEYLMDPEHKWVIMRAFDGAKVAGSSDNLEGKQFKSKDFIDLSGGGELGFHSVTDDKMHYSVDTKGKGGIRVSASWD